MGFRRWFVIVVCGVGVFMSVGQSKTTNLGHALTYPTEEDRDWDCHDQLDAQRATFRGWAAAASDPQPESVPRRA